MIKSKNKDIVYISFRSTLKISQKFINFLYEGLIKMNIAVLWSLREGALPEKNDNFFVFFH